MSHEPSPSQRFDRPLRAATHRRRIVVAGAGLAGLVVAYRRMRQGDEVTLLEAGVRLGGQLWSEVEDGFVVEHGAEGFSPASAAVRGLARDLAIAAEIVGQKVQRSFGFDGHALEALAAGEAPARLGLRAPAGQGAQGIASFRRGMGELVVALASAMRGRVEVRLAEPIRSLSPSGAGWEVVTDGARVRADQVVLATSSRAAGELLRPVLEEANALANAPAISSVTVSVAYPRSAIRHPLDGTGFVIAESMSVEGCRACTFSSSKLPDRCPEGYALLRLFFRPSDDELESFGEQTWIERAGRVLDRVLGVDTAPLRAWVDRWPHAMAVVDNGQRDLVAALEPLLLRRGLLLAGGAFHGTGIDGAVRSGEDAAATLSALERAS